VSSSVEHVYRCHAGVVRRALRSFGVEGAALDDAVQDVFVVLVRRHAEFDPGGSWTNWVWGIARRVARGYRRGDGRRERLHAALPRSSANTTPEDELAQRRALAFLDAFARDLPPALLDTFVLVELEGRTGPEVAAATGANLNTVYARIRAVRRRFDDAIAAELAPARTGAWGWFSLASWWTPVATTAALVLAVGLGDIEPAREDATIAIADAAVPEPLAIARATIPALAPAHDDEIVIDPEIETPEPRRRKRRAQRAAVNEPEPTATEARPEPLQPDGERIVVRRPTPTPIVVRPKSDFVAELRVLAPAG